ncbi:lipopolysaccharide-induced tumor necrosis factor-alpha factor homolog [Drosophila albomicans]|uniref:Lipopolysaccharide-induced tumor necrosis factor-alpha factor homolog n=1 Tax=Drosophila albomicans TaxID=7291 RepID=A0A6P8XCH9_DROAB|nr:lipopolysaccharide-induced tumor necrosis factor-alpha factor homolog [Drosophila albomicans]
MDQKRAMLYPQVDFNTPPSAPLATPAVGPIEAPPSYDVATAAQPAPVIVVNAQPLPQQQQQHQHQPQQLEPTIVPAAPSNLGPNPCRVLCPACGVQKTTRMTHTANARTHLAAALICLVGWCVCACFVPYCMNSCRTGNHYCRKCNTFLGVYNPKGVK